MYTHIMLNVILMSRYKGQLHGGKRAKKFRQGPLPLFGQCRKKTYFFSEGFPFKGKPSEKKYGVILQIRKIT